MIETMTILVGICILAAGDFEPFIVPKKKILPGQHQQIKNALFNDTPTLMTPPG